MRINYILHGETLEWLALLDFEAGAVQHSWATLIVLEYFRCGLDV